MWHELVRNMALATTPAVLLGQAGRTPCSNYVFKLFPNQIDIISPCIIFGPEQTNACALHEITKVPCDT